MHSLRTNAVRGALLGMAVGDALGLPYEGLSPQRAHRLFGSPDRYRFFFRRGMVSDDTEHACLTAQALIASAGEPKLFLKELGRRIRWWFAGVSAGLGKATLKSSLRLWLGISPASSGVNSVGNGGAMRSVILGAALPDDMPRLRELVRLSTRVTHRNVKAELGSWIVALAAAHSVRSPDISPASFRAILAEFVDWQGQEQFEQLMEQALQSAEARQSTTEFAQSIGRSRGVSGYIVYTTPVVIQAWLRYGDDFPTAVQETIRCGGDADTTAAIVGGLVAARLGVESIPQSWQDGICEWPRTVTWMDQLGQHVQEVIESGIAQRPATLPWWGLVPRNLLFLFIVLVHVIRRAFPPY